VIVSCDLECTVVSMVVVVLSLFVSRVALRLPVNVVRNKLSK